MTQQITRAEAEKIFQEYSAYVFKTALFLSRSKEMADDITQETFLKIYKGYPTFDNEKPIRPWIYKITLNTVRNMLRKQRWLSFFNEIPETSADVLDTVVQDGEDRRILWKAVNKLSLKRKEVIILHFYLGMKLNETAMVLDIPLGTCKSRLNGALNALKKHLSNSNLNTFSVGGRYYETN